jgi:hypothetical protein
MKAYYEANKEKKKAYRDKEKKKVYDKAYYEANKEKKKAYKKAWYEANKDKIKARDKAYYEANRNKQKAYREANKEKIKAQKKAHYEANKDKIKAYYEANKNKILAKNKAYYEANSAYYIEKARFRQKLLKKLQRPNWYNSKLVNKIYNKCHKLNKIAGFIKYHVDHIVPLQGENVSGLHVQDNLQIILAGVNLSKGNKFEV